MKTTAPSQTSASTRLFDTGLADMIRSHTALMIDGSLIAGRNTNELPPVPVRAFESIRHLILWLSVVRAQMQQQCGHRTLLTSITLAAPLMSVDRDRSLTLSEVFDLSLLQCRTSPILTTVREAAIVHLGLPLAEAIVQAFPARLIRENAAALSRWATPHPSAGSRSAKVGPGADAVALDPEKIRAGLSAVEMLWTQAEWVIEEIEHRLGHLPIGALLLDVDRKAIAAAQASASC